MGGNPGDLPGGWTRPTRSFLEVYASNARVLGVPVNELFSFEELKSD